MKATGSVLHPGMRPRPSTQPGSAGWKTPSNKSGVPEENLPPQSDFVKQGSIKAFNCWLNLIAYLNPPHSYVQSRL